MGGTVVLDSISRDEPCPDCGHAKYNHSDHRCGECPCTNTFVCRGCGHAWFHHHFANCEGGSDCPCDRRP